MDKVGQLSESGNEMNRGSVRSAELAPQGIRVKLRFMLCNGSVLKEEIKQLVLHLVCCNI